MSSRKNKKYSNALKIKAVEEFLAGNGSRLEICRKYDFEMENAFIKNARNRKKVVASRSKAGEPIFSCQISE